LSDNVGEQLALEPGDLVLQRQLALLEALQLDRVERPALALSRDGLVELAVLALQRVKLRLDRLDVEIHERNGRTRG
jgi:hypothetical protein